MDSSIAKGKGMLMVIIGIMLGISLISVIFFSSDKMITGIVRFILTGLLCYFLYQGRSWAKWVTAVLMLISAAIGLLGALAILIKPLLGLYSLMMAIAYGISGIVLIVSKSVNEFMGYQRGNKDLSYILVKNDCLQVVFSDCLQAVLFDDGFVITR